MKRKQFYITTPIYYPSARLHIGHGYTTVAADVMARYKRMKGFDVMFLTGTDEHGQKIQQSAAEAGVSPKEFVDRMAEGIKNLWSLLNISYDRFIRTTDEYHEKAVQEIFQKLYDKGDIYLSKYKGWYCTSCEAFWTETQLNEGKCPDCGKDVKLTEEESYFFRLSKYRDRLLKLLKDNPDFVNPVSRANEMIKNFLEPGLDDLAVSRTSFDWGVKVPFDKKHVIYVWIDALVNYITALGYPDEQGDFSKYWPADVQLVGKDIIRFHTLIWPALLMSLELPLPERIYGHGWLLMNGGKMSKSKGNVVDPELLCNRYSVDALRYFLMREVPFGSDGSFSNESLVHRINLDLSNDLGNLLSRTTAMINKYFAGTLPESREAGPEDDELISSASELAKRADRLFDELRFSSVLQEIWKLISKGNKYIDLTMPWILAKEEGKKKRLSAVLFNLAELLRIVAVTLTPFMPDSASKIFFALEIDDEKQKTWDSAYEFGLWRPAKPVAASKPLFPRLDMEKEIDFMNGVIEKQMKIAASGKSAAEEKDKNTKSGEADEKNKKSENALPEEISYEDFSKLELVAARVLSCEKLEGADKLLKFSLDIGEEKPRTVLSGIAPAYSPDELTGKTLVLLKNLKPRKIRGVISEGMLLSGEGSNGSLSLLSFDRDINPGGKIS